MKRFLREERGSMLDVVIIPTIVLALLLVMLIMWTILDSFPAGFIDAGYIDKGKNIYIIFDKALIFIIVGLIISAAALASQIQSHPVFAIPALIFLAIAVVLSASIANIAYDAANTPQFSTAGNEFTRTLFIVQNLPKIVLGAGIIIILALYAKPAFMQRTPY